MDSILLSAENLDVSILKKGNGQRLLEAISFSLKAGETLGIVGPSGSGKTMLARALIGLLPDGVKFTGGAIRYAPGNEEAYTINTLTEAECDSFRKAHVAMIFQNPGLSLNPSLRIEKQFRIVSALGGSPASPKACRAVLTSMGFRDPERILRAYPHQLSGGELQRTIIGMTILKAPRLWIADEPTTALDAETRMEIIALFKRVRDELGASMIYISHDIGTVRHLVDRVMFMRSGRIENIADAGALNVRTPGSGTVSGIGYGGHRTDQGKLPALEKPVIEVESVSKQFGQGFSFGFNRKYRVGALRDVSFRLGVGESLGMIGPSGSGKSTIGRILTGLVKADTGSVRFQGRELTGSTEKEWRAVRREVQLIHQNPAQSLTPQMTVQQLLAEALQLAGRITGKEGRDREIERLMEELGLPPALKPRYPFQISGGEAQRVAIARALALRPLVLICDEITSALDRENQQQLIELMARLREEHTFSLLWITHDLHVVRQVADRLILLDKGQVIERGIVKDFFSGPVSDQGKRMLEAYGMFT